MTTSDDAASGAPASARIRLSSRGLLLSGGLVLGWTLLMRTFGGDDVYPVLGPYALAVVAAVVALRGRTLRKDLAPSRTAVVSGLLVGIAMTLATYPVFRLAAELFPALRPNVAALYRAAATRSAWQSLPWVVAIVVAEELLFRGLLLDALRFRRHGRIAAAASVALYVLAQAGTGSAIVASMALVCGIVWTVQRMSTRSLLSPLLSHLVWTPMVILFRPVL